MKISYKAVLPWGAAFLLCIFLLVFGEANAYAAEGAVAAFERSNVSDAAVTDGQYFVTDRPVEKDGSIIVKVGEGDGNTADAENNGGAGEAAGEGEASASESAEKKTGIVEGYRGGPGVSAAAEESFEEETDESSAEGTDGIFHIDGAAYKKSELVGNYKLTGYCNCELCGGGQHTYSGTVPRANHTVAADLSALPLGTKIIVEGTSGKTVHSFDGIYEVEDKGSGVSGNHIDIYFDTHAEARAVTDPGWQYANVWIAVPAEE